MNGGSCTEGWNRFLCDCSASSFNGPTCGKGQCYALKLLINSSTKSTCYQPINHTDAATLSFDGSQHFRVPFESAPRTEAEDWRLRFRTPKPSGLLLSTVSDQSLGRVELDLEGGRLRFTQFSIDRPKVNSRIN